jgi:hypothetical protein
MLNEQHQTVDIAQQFSCELEFKKIKVINAEVPIQDYLQVFENILPRCLDFNSLH